MSSGSCDERNGGVLQSKGTIGKPLQAILDYVNTPRTQYAVLIEGPWGCGKTYFWKKSAEPELRKIQMGEGHCRPLYVSLYGCSRTRDIDTQLFLASHPQLRGEWTKRLSSIGGNVCGQIVKLFTRIELPPLDLRWFANMDNAVVCFDDLERAKLSMKEALGYINTFVEHEGVKTVILANEAGIDEASDKQTYLAMKEKVVGASLRLCAVLDEVFPTLAAEYSSRPEFQAFLSQEASRIQRLFEKSETQNIRALQRAMTALSVVCETIENSEVDLDAIAKQLINAVVPAALEVFGRGATSEQIQRVLSTSRMPVAVLSLRDEGVKEAGEETYEEGFATRYFGELGLFEFDEAVGCPPVGEFLITGFLDRVELIEWARELVRPADEAQQRINRLCADPRRMRDDEFAEDAATVLQEVESGEIRSMDTCDSLYRCFDWFAGRGLIEDNPTEVLAKFDRGLGKAEERGRLEGDRLLGHRLEDPAMRLETEEGRAFHGLLRAANQRVLARGPRERVKALAARFGEDPGTFIDALVEQGEPGLLGIPVFQELDADELAGRLLALENDMKRSVCLAMRWRYLDRPVVRDLAEEIPVLSKLRDVFRGGAEGQPDDRRPLPMSCLLDREISEVLGAVVERLQRISDEGRTRDSGADENRLTHGGPAVPSEAGGDGG